MGLVLKHEGQRVGYLIQQMKSPIAAQDEVSNLHEDHQEHPFSLATERIHLARDIYKKIYYSLFVEVIHDKRSRMGEQVSGRRKWNSVRISDRYQE